MKPETLNGTDAEVATQLREKGRGRVLIPGRGPWTVYVNEGWWNVYFDGHAHAHDLIRDDELEGWLGGKR